MLPESLPELLDLLGSTVLAAVLTAVGTVAERAAVADLVAGQSTFGAWELFMGAILLYAGVYMLGYRRVWRTLASGA